MMMNGNGSGYGRLVSKEAREGAEAIKVLGSRAERKALVTYQVLLLLEVENVNDGLNRTKVFRRSRIDDG
jgi:hypothetical protein